MFTLLNTRRICYLRRSILRTGAARRVEFIRSGRTRTSRIDFEAFFARAEDPWGYTNDFERMKYEQTLALLDGLHIGRALELACAEGHFTKMLSPRVAELLATDISEIALQRAAKSCADCSNVSYHRLDLVEDAITGPFDLIVCSEVLYYLEDLAILREVARKIAGALSDGGNLLMAHANLVVDEPDCPGRDWGHAFGAKTMEDTFRATDGTEPTEASSYAAVSHPAVPAWCSKFDKGTVDSVCCNG